MTPTRLYRWFDAAGQLLYVGISSQPRTRTSQHVKTAPWIHLATRMELDPVAYEHRNEALRAEAHAITTESPIHNIARPKKAKPRRSRGRPSVGPRIHVNLPAEDIAWLDGIVAERAGEGVPTTRAAVIREIIGEVRRADEWEWIVDSDGETADSKETQP